MIKINTVDDTSWFYEKVKTLIINGTLKGARRNTEINAKVVEINNELISIRSVIENDLNDNEKHFNDLDFEKLVTYGYKELELLKKKIDDANYIFEKSSDKYVCEIWNIFISAYRKFSSHNLNNKIVENFNITVCPYCNRNFVNNVSRNKASAQLDHFFDKGKYPIFALSLFNLVPCCQVCNHSKGSKPILKSPHDNDVDYLNNIKISYIPKEEDYIDNHESLEVVVRSLNDEYDSNIEVLNLEEAYKIHNDYVQELLYKHKIYNETFFEETKKVFEGLFSDKAEMLKYAYGNYTDEIDLGKRPLSKLTRDILLERGVDID